MCGISSDIIESATNTDKSLDDFTAGIRAAARGLWNGALTTLDFADAFYATLRRGFESAWTEGGKSCGILAGERTQEETKQLGLMIGDNFQYVAGLADWIFQHSKANNGDWNAVVSRMALWVNRYEEVKNVAMTMACQNRKLTWRLGIGKSGKSEHCRSCLKLNGRVARSKTWAARGLYPKMTNGMLRCGGFNCHCVFVETDLPATRGRWPNLP